MDCAVEIIGLCSWDPTAVSRISARACGPSDGTVCQLVTDTCRPRKDSTHLFFFFLPPLFLWSRLIVHLELALEGRLGLFLCLFYSRRVCVFLDPCSPSVPVICCSSWWSSWKSTGKAQVFQDLRVEHLRDRPTFFLLVFVCITFTPCCANKVFISICLPKTVPPLEVRWTSSG